jgi:putative molybdopterin biosynthesis protein
MKMISELGRTEYVLVSLTERPEAGLAAYPIGKGSGAVTAFSLADGFFAIPAQTEMVPAGMEISVTIIGAAAEPADLMIIGSHCVGLDYLIGLLAREGVTAKVLSVGSTAGLMAAKRGECDIAGIHLVDPVSGIYNRSYVDDTLQLVRGYGRLQGAVYQRDDPRFAGLDGQSQRGQRHAHTDRPFARRCQARRLQPSGSLAQCCGGGHRAATCRLGRGDRDRGAALWPRIPAAAGRGI